MSISCNVSASSLKPEALLRLLTSAHHGDSILGIGRGSLSLMQLFAVDTTEATLIEQSNELSTAEVAGIQSTFIEDWCKMPFPSASVDLVLLPSPSDWPQKKSKLQKWLAEIRRILSDEGEVLLVAPNRFSYKRVRNLLSGKGSGIAAWSYSGYKRLLAAAGLEIVDCYGIHRDRTQLVVSALPVGQAQSRWSPPTPKRIVDKIKLRCCQADEFMLRAAPQFLLQSIANHICDQAARELKLENTQLKIRRLFASVKGKAFLVLFSEKQTWVARIPLTSAATTATQHHAAMLQLTRDYVGRVDWLPTIVASNKIEGVHYLIETAVSGRALKYALDQGQSKSESKNYLFELEATLKKINLPNNPLRTAAVLDGELYDQMIMEPLGRVFSWVDCPKVREQVSGYFKHYLHRMSFIPGITHGDLSVSNIFVSGSRISGIIDWDDARAKGIPVLDAINHLISRELYRLQRRAYSEVLYRLAFRTWPNKAEHDFLDRMYRYHQVDPIHHPGLVYLNWLYTAEARLAEDAGKNTGLTKRYVDEVINLLIKSGRLL